MRERIPCVYIVAGGYHATMYTGVTSNLLGRVEQHRSGTFDGFTKRYGIKRLVYYEEGDTMEAVILREKQIKKWRREYKYNLIEQLNAAWNDLAVGLGLPPLTDLRGRADAVPLPIVTPALCRGLPLNGRDWWWGAKRRCKLALFKRKG